MLKLSHLAGLGSFTLNSSNGMARLGPEVASRLGRPQFRLG